jgi:hypothetical protein
MKLYVLKQQQPNRNQAPGVHHRMNLTTAADHQLKAQHARSSPKEFLRD